MPKRKAKKVDTGILYSDLVWRAPAWLDEFDQMCRQQREGHREAAEAGDTKEVHRLDSKRIIQLKDKWWEGMEQAIEAALKIPVITSDSRELKKKSLIRLSLVFQFRRTCFHLEIDPKGWVEGAHFGPIIQELYKEQWDEVCGWIWTACLINILPKLTERPPDRLDPGCGFLLLQYDFVLKKIQKLCRGKTKLVRREVVEEQYPEIKSIYDDPEGPHHHKDEPSYYAGNLVAHWRNTSYSEITRRIARCRRSARVMKEQGVDIIPDIDMEWLDSFTRMVAGGVAAATEAAKKRSD